MTRTVGPVVVSALIALAAGAWLGASWTATTGPVAPVVGVEVVVTLPPEQEIPYELFADPTHTPAPPTPTAGPTSTPRPTATPYRLCPSPAGTVCKAPKGPPPTPTPIPTWPGAARQTPGAVYVMPLPTGEGMEVGA